MGDKIWGKAPTPLFIMGVVGLKPLMGVVGVKPLYYVLGFLENLIMRA